MAAQPVAQAGWSDPGQAAKDPERLVERIVSACASRQIGTSASMRSLPFRVNAQILPLPFSAGLDSISSISSRRSRLRVSVVRSKPRDSARSLTVRPGTCRIAAISDSCVEVMPRPRRCLS